jgi:hypothetical protein
MRYQTIRASNRVANVTSFGRRLRRFLRKPEQEMLLPEGSGWRGQGAWILADALVHWSGRRLSIACLRANDSTIEHIVAAEPRMQVFVDADGVAGQIDLITKMAVIMRLPNVFLADFSVQDAIAAGITYDENVAIELAIRLLHRFGPYRPELLSLQPTTPNVAAGTHRLMTGLCERIGMGRVPCPGGVPVPA